MRVAPSPYRHFERSREIFLAHWSEKCGRAVNTVLHTTWNDGLPHMYCFPACKKDPSAALGMTKREDGLSYIPLHPAAGANLRPFGAPPSRGRREKSKILLSMEKAAKREYRCPTPKAFPSRGRCPKGADRALAVRKRVGKYVSSRRKMRVAPSPHRHFEQSEKSSLHTGETESVR